MLSAFRLTVRVSSAVQRACQCPARALHSSPVLWAGHNKWSKVKDIKIPKDAARARMIAKFTMMIRIAVRGEKIAIIQSATNQQVLFLSVPWGSFFFFFFYHVKNIRMTLV